MKARALRVAVAMTVALALGTGCSKEQASSTGAPSIGQPVKGVPSPPPNSPSSPPSAPATPPTTTATQPMGEGGPAGSMGPPLTVELTQKDASAKGTTIVATITASAKLPFPLTIKATPPTRSRLTEGQAEETINVEQKGTITRTYRIAMMGPLTADAPFRLTIDGKGAAMGLHTEKTFPSKEGGAPTASGSAPAGSASAPAASGSARRAP